MAEEEKKLTVKTVKELARLMYVTERTILRWKKKGMPPQTWVLMVVGSLVTAYVLAHFVEYLNAATFMDALQAGFWIWIGFFAAVMIGMVLWEGKPWKLYFLVVAYHLVNLLMMDSILTLWP